MYFQHTASSYLGVLGTAVLLGLMVPSTATAVEATENPAVISPAPAGQRCMFKRIEQQVFRCESDGVTGAKATVPLWVPVYEECYSLLQVNPGEGGPTLQSRK